MLLHIYHRMFLHAVFLMRFEQRAARPRLVGYQELLADAGLHLDRKLPVDHKHSICNAHHSLMLVDGRFFGMGLPLSEMLLKRVWGRMRRSTR